MSCRIQVFITGVVSSLLAISATAAEPAPRSETPVPVQLASAGESRLVIVISPDASEPVRSAAETLARYLSRIASAEFEIREGDGREGIALGLPADFPVLNLHSEFDATGPAGREQYLLRSHRQGLYAVAASELGVRHAVWDLLYRLGHRQFFPGQVWEVVPNESELAVAVDANESPDYLTRRIWFGYGVWDFNKAAYEEWCERNRMGGAFELNTGHAYDRIIKDYTQKFEQHPEYYALVDGRRTGSKLCSSNPGVRALVVDYARDFFSKNPNADSVSVDPSDGGGWCECEACRALGSPSDRALTLANDVSVMLEEEFPAKYVALYAYNYHAPPPTIRARPRVIVNAATAFLKGQDIDEVIEGWKRQGVQQFGIREYYGVNVWDRDLPGRSRGSDLSYLSRTIPAFHKQGARYLSAESSEAWGPNGLGFSLAARLMWDIDESEAVDDLKRDFLEKAFGPAREPMADFYKLLDGSDPPLLSSHLVGRMYRLLHDARARAAGNPQVIDRLDQLVLYTRYVELYRTYSAASGGDRQAGFEQLMRHAYRMSRSMMIHSRGLFRDLPNRDKTVTLPELARADVPEEKNPWKTTQSWSRIELDQIIDSGIARHPLAEFTAVDFGDDLVPAGPLNLPDLPPLKDTSRTRGEFTYSTWFEQAPADLELKVTGGLIEHYRDRGDVELRLTPGGGVHASEEAMDDVTPESTAAVPPDGKQRTVRLSASKPGLHRLWLSDGSDMTEVLWPANMHRTIKAEAGSESHFSGRRSGYFYVPRGTKTAGGYAEGEGAVHDADGNLVHRFTPGEYFSIPVPSGHAGRLWSLRDCSAAVGLMTVPPCLARTSRELLLPRSVVEADARRLGQGR